MTKKIAVILLLIITLATFSSCVNLDNYELKMSTPEVDAYVEDFMSSIEGKDYDDFLLKYYGEEYAAQVSDTIAEDFSFVEGTMTRYRKIRFDSNARIDDGEIKNKEIQYIYIIDTDQSSYTLIVNVEEQNDQVIFIGSNLYPGGVENFKDDRFNGHPWQIMLLAYSLLCYGFIIFVIVKCIKSRVRLKPLWILGIIAQSGFQIRHVFANGQINSGFHIHFASISISSFTNYGEHGYILIILFPLIALIFLRSLNKLELKADAYRAKKAAVPAIESEPSENE